MSILSRFGSIFGRGEPQNDAVEFSPELWAAIQANGLRQTSWERAIQVSVVLACARIYANDLAAVPWKIMQDKENGDKIEAKDHPYYDMITWSPNPWQTSFEFRQTVGFHLAIDGNSYVWLDRAGARSEKIVGMLPLNPSWVTVCRDTKDWSKIKYRVSFPDGTNIETDNRFVWHLRNLAWDGYRGISALAYAREAIGLAQDISSSQSDNHKNAAKPSGVLSVDQVMDAQQFARMRKLVDIQVQERLSRGLPMVVDKTMKWEQLAAKATDMQTVESRKQIIEEIAIHMGILPAMTGYMGDGSQSYASVEQLLIRHNIHFKYPLMTNFMQSADRWILAKSDRRHGYYNNLVDQALLRGDIKARGEFYRLMWMIGAITDNEIRQFEDMNRKDGLDYTWAPLANAPIGPDGKPIVPETAAVDNNLKQSDQSDIANLFLKSSPSDRARFVAMMQDLIKPEEGGTL